MAILGSGLEAFPLVQYVHTCKFPCVLSGTELEEGEIVISAIAAVGVAG